MLLFLLPVRFPWRWCSLCNLSNCIQPSNSTGLSWWKKAQPSLWQMKITHMRAIWALLSLLAPLLISNLDSHPRVGDIMGGWGISRDWDDNRSPTTDGNTSDNSIVPTAHFYFHFLYFVHWILCVSKSYVSSSHQHTHFCFQFLVFKGSSFSMFSLQKNWVVHFIFSKRGRMVLYVWGQRNDQKVSGGTGQNFQRGQESGEF